MIGQIVRMFDHLKWADERVLLAMRRSGERHEGSLGLYGHILGAEHVWLARLEGRTPTVAVWPTMGLEEYEAVGTANHAAYRDYIETLDELALTRMIEYRNSAGREFESRIDDILTHVALHGAYHRGQVAHVVRSGGDAPIPTDYIAFVRGAAAATHPTSVHRNR